MNREFVGLILLGELLFFGGIYLIVFASKPEGLLFCILGMIISSFAIIRNKKLKATLIINKN
ncbi:MAG: hypothetical protein K8R11_02170 [Methanococcoides sp.]|nr:hypothetical protein [Methanococcoides sp.]